MIVQLNTPPVWVYLIVWYTIWSGLVYYTFTLGMKLRKYRREDKNTKRKRDLYLAISRLDAGKKLREKLRESK